MMNYGKTAQYEFTINVASEKCWCFINVTQNMRVNVTDRIKYDNNKAFNYSIENKQYEGQNKNYDVYIF